MSVKSPNSAYRIPRVICWGLLPEGYIIIAVRGLSVDQDTPHTSSQDTRTGHGTLGALTIDGTANTQIHLRPYRSTTRSSRGRTSVALGQVDTWRVELFWDIFHFLPVMEIWLRIFLPVEARDPFIRDIHSFGLMMFSRNTSTTASQGLNRSISIIIGGNSTHSHKYQHAMLEMMRLYSFAVL